MPQGWKIPQQEAERRATTEECAHELPHASMRTAKSQSISAKGCMIERLSVT